MHDETARLIHPAYRERPRDIAKLLVYGAELDEMNSVRQEYGLTWIVGTNALPIIRAFSIEVLCQDAETAHALGAAWDDYGAKSPHRPRTDEEWESWSERHNPYPNVPREW